MTWTLRVLLTITSLWLAALPNPVSAQMTVQSIDIGLPHTTAIMMRGEMLGNEILRLKEMVSQLPSAKRLVVLLDSPGGLTQQGFDLGRFFHDAKIITMIPDGAICLSACALAFLGGRDPETSEPLRILSAGGKLGYHNFRRNWENRPYSKTDIENISRDAQMRVFEHMSYYRYVRAPIRFMQIGAGAKASSMNMVSEGDALELGISILNKDTGKLISPLKITERLGR